MMHCRVQRDGSSWSGFRQTAWRVRRQSMIRWLSCGFSQAGMPAIAVSMQYTLEGDQLGINNYNYFLMRTRDSADVPLAELFNC